MKSANLRGWDMGNAWLTKQIEVSQHVRVERSNIGNVVEQNHKEHMAY